VQWYDQLLSPLIWGVSWIIVQFHKLFGLVFLPDSGWAWGLSIVFLTLVIRAALIPPFLPLGPTAGALRAIAPLGAYLGIGLLAIALLAIRLVAIPLAA